MRKKLKPEVLKKLKEKNIKGKEKEDQSHLSNGDNENDLRETGNDKRPSEVIIEMENNGIEKSLCSFTHKFYLQLRNNNRKVLQPCDIAAYVKAHGIKKENPDVLVDVITAMETCMKKMKGFKMRMNQVATLMVLLFGSSEVSLHKKIIVRNFIISRKMPEVHFWN